MTPVGKMNIFGFVLLLLFLSGCMQKSCFNADGVPVLEPNEYYNSDEEGLTSCQAEILDAAEELSSFDLNTLILEDGTSLGDVERQMAQEKLKAIHSLNK